MPRLRLLAAGTVAALAAVPAASASAKITELGSIPNGTVAPTCPAKKPSTAPSDFCRIVTRTTGYQVRSGAGHEAPVTVPSDGRVVAFTLSLGDLSSADIAKADKTYGGQSLIRLTALRKVKHKKLFRSVVGQSNDVKAAPFFGGTTQFALSKALVVKKGDIIAITVKTWAPMLALGLDETNAWRTSRPTGSCDDFTSQSAMTTLATSKMFGCTYTTARLTYTASFIPKAKPRFNKKHQPIKKKK